MIVVGVDGSAESKCALRWAVEEARKRQTPLRAVYAWLYPTVGGRGYIPSDLLDPELLRGRALELLRGAVDEAVGEQAHVEVECMAPEGSAARVLLEASSEAELVIVGSRGHGGFGALLLGSVSQQCAQHALCPVVIVPGV